MPILIKDNIDVHGYPTTAGTPGLAGVYPRAHAPVVQRLLDAGAIVAGKANLHELAVGGTSRNDHFGFVVNPWRAEVIAGGSNGGSAVAVAARLVPGALGTDTNGSVRGPCAMNGIAGVRPSFQRYPYGGTFPSTTTRDSVCGMATTVTELAKLERPYREALEIHRPRLQAQLAAYFREHRLDALIFPTTPFPAMAVTNDLADVVINGKRVANGFGYVIQNTVYQSAAGIPSLTVPAGMTEDGLPVGISFDGPVGRDRRLLGIGLAFERVRGEFAVPGVVLRSA